MIEKLVLDRFRGATKRTEILFPLEQRLVVIFGQNGSGKSTLVDAIEVVCGKTAGSLTARSGASARDLPSLGSSRSDVRVELYAGDRMWGLEDRRNSSPPRVQVLRRHQILALAEATPSEKFEQIKRFVDVSGVQRSEDALKKAADMAEDRRRKAIDDQARARDGIEQFWVGEGRPGAPEINSLAWAKSVQDSGREAACAHIAELESLLQAVDSAHSIRQAGRDARNTVHTIEAELNALTAEIQDNAGALSSSGASFVSLLRQMLQYLDKAGQIQACPICRSGATAEELRGSIEERLEPLTKLSRLTDEIEAKQEALKSARERLQGYRIEYEKAADTIRDSVQSAHPGLNKILSGAVAGDLATLVAEPTRLAQAILSVRSRLSDERQRLQQSVGLQNAVGVYLAQMNDSERSAALARAAAESLREIHRVVLECRREYVQETLTAVSDECDGFYRLLHPDESITLGAMALDPNRKASLVQTAIINGIADCSPQAFLSDSHLDTMGFCFWLALAMRESGPDSILIIDDALTSVDSAHAARIARLLHQVSKQFTQVIVTTHEPEWLACFTGLSDGVGVIRLGNWSMDVGITL